MPIATVVPYRYSDDWCSAIERRDREVAMMARTTAHNHASFFGRSMTDRSSHPFNNDTDPDIHDHLRHKQKS